MNIGITGSAGMIGWHLRCHLLQFPDHVVSLADRSTFEDPDKLAEFVKGVDVIVHLAGQNRGDEKDIAETNPALAQQLVNACDAGGSTPHIIYASSTHAAGDSAYGRSKQAASDIFNKWSKGRSARFTNLVLPHVFGEGTKPFYNSAVATFAHQLAVGETPEVINDSELELVHAQDVCREILAAAANGTTGDVRVSGNVISVSDVLARLQALASRYDGGVIPNLDDMFDLRLFNLYRHYLFPQGYPRDMPAFADDRGVLVETAKADNGGQTFISTTRPGVTRGNHFHYHKVERFVVVDGEASIRIRRLFSDEVHTFDVDGEKPVFIDMPTLHTHNITNTGQSDLLTVFWSNEIFDPDAPDTIAENV